MSEALASTYKKSDIHDNGAIFIWFLANEKKKISKDPSYKSKIKEYLDILPSDSRDFPTDYNAEEMAYLKGTCAE